MYTVSNRYMTERNNVARNLQVERRRPRGRPKKSWQRTLEEDMTLMGIDPQLANDHHGWREAIKRPTTDHTQPDTAYRG